MKNNFYLIGLAFLFGFGCQSEATSPNAQGGKNTASQSAPTLSVTFNHAPATIGEPVTVAGSVAEDIAGTTAKVQLFQAFDSDPAHNANAAPVSCDYSGSITWVRVAQSDNGVGSVSYTWTPTANGHYGFRVHYVKGNSENDNLIGPCMNLEVTDGSNGPTVTTTVQLMGGDILYEPVLVYRVTWTVCAGDEELTNVRLGGDVFFDPMWVPEFNVWPDEGDVYNLYYEGQPMAWHIASIPAGECVTRIAGYFYSANGSNLTGEWSLDYDTPTQTGQHITLDPVVVP